MSALSDAPAAMGKLHFDEEFQQFLGPANAWEAIDKSKLLALAWIEKALPIVRLRIKEIERRQEIRAELEDDECDLTTIECWKEEGKQLSSELAALDALLEEAKGEGK